MATIESYETSTGAKRYMVRCLDTCQGPDNPPRYEPVITEEYVRVLREDSQRAGRPAVATDTAERLKSA